MNSDFRDKMLRRIEQVRAAQQVQPPPGIHAPLPAEPQPARGGLSLGARRWHELYAMSISPVTDRAATLKRIGDAATGIEGGCGCESKWRRYVAAHPPTIDTREAFEAWVVDAHNDKNAELGKPILTLEQARAVNPWPVHATSSGGGIGDTIVALYACAGLAKATGRQVEFHARWSDWISRASAPGVTIVPYTRDYGTDISGGWDGPYGYHKATASAPSRVWAYCANLAAAFGIQSFEPVRPIVDTSVARLTASGRYAVLAPFVSDNRWAARQWPTERWTELAHGLTQQGLAVVGIGAGEQRDALAEVLWGVPGATWRYGVSPAEIVDLLIGSAVTVANDSGIAHVGGLLGVSTVAIHAGSLPHEYLFAMAPTVTSVTSTQAIPRSDANAEGLQGIPVEDVLAMCECRHPALNC
jgi:hypothetical protein